MLNRSVVFEWFCGDTFQALRIFKKGILYWQLLVKRLFLFFFGKSLMFQGLDGYLVLLKVFFFFFLALLRYLLEIFFSRVLKQIQGSVPYFLKPAEVPLQT